MHVIITETLEEQVDNVQNKNVKRLEVVFDKELGLTVQENEKTGTISLDLTPQKTKQRKTK